MSKFLKYLEAKQGCFCPTISANKGRAAARASAKHREDGSSQCRLLYEGNVVFKLLRSMVLRPLLQCSHGRETVENGSD